MADVFISYARSTEEQAIWIADALRGAGVSVWRDEEIPSHRAFSEVIEEELDGARAVIVVWSAEAARSHWVRAEADKAREAGKLTQVNVDGTMPPMPFNQIQCASLSGWDGNPSDPAWKKVEANVQAMVGPAEAAEPAAARDSERFSICVLPFLNMSGDPEQEYFSDGITEDIITDLSKISALSVVARNTAFTFKGQSQPIPKIARSLDVTHVVEGSVRKAGGRVRITAQLVDGMAGDHVWAERYDRDLTDIFAIQDEISKAIVEALQLTLLPKEKRAIEQRQTQSAAAYDLYLLARKLWVTGNLGDSRRDEIIVRIARKAAEIDPNYAKAWALAALAETELRFWHMKDVDAMATAEKALAIDPRNAEAQCVRARYRWEEGRIEEANEAIAMAIAEDGDSWEVSREAARLYFREGRMEEAVRFFEKAVAAMDTDFNNGVMLLTCYTSLKDEQGLKRAAKLTLERAEATVVNDPINGSALAAGAGALAALGDVERTREWAQRALLVAPENFNMRYNLGCVMSAQLRDVEGALGVLGPYFETCQSLSQLKHAEVDPDIDLIRDDPRFTAMFEAAWARIVGAEKEVEPA